MVLSTFAATYLFFLFVTTNLSKPRDKGGLGGGVCKVWGSSAGSFFSPSSLPLPTVSPWQLTDERGIPGYWRSRSSAPHPKPLLYHVCPFEQVPFPLWASVPPTERQRRQLRSSPGSLPALILSSEPESLCHHQAS